jgi:hypothetical protein
MFVVRAVGVTIVPLAGPETLVHKYVIGSPFGSVAVAVKLTLLTGRVIVLSNPAFTTGAWLAKYESDAGFVIAGLLVPVRVIFPPVVGVIVNV